MKPAATHGSFIQVHVDGQLDSGRSKIGICCGQVAPSSIDVSCFSMFVFPTVLTRDSRVKACLSFQPSWREPTEPIM